MNRTRIEAAETIERFVSGDAGDYDWEDFTYISSHDPLVEKIRVECLHARDRFPPTNPKAYCSEEGSEYLLSLAAQLRDRSTEPEYPRKKRKYLFRRFPITTYTSIGIMLSLLVDMLGAAYDASGIERLFYWLAQLFSLIPWAIRESFFSLVNWYVSLILGLIASIAIDLIIHSALVRVGRKRE